MKASCQAIPNSRISIQLLKTNETTIDDYKITGHLK